MTSYEAEDIYKKRSMYRRPSVLGVPGYNFEQQTTYTSSLEGYEPTTPTKAQPPPSNLGPMEGNMSKYKTEVQRWYKPYEVEPPERAKMSDHLPYVTGDSNIETRRTRDDYNIETAERPAPFKPETRIGTDGDFDFNTDKKSSYKSYDVKKNSKMAAPSDNLRLSGGLNSNRSRDDYGADIHNQKGRSTPVRPSSNLKNFGEHDFQTEKRSNFQPFDSSARTKVTREGIKKKGDNLGILDGDFDWETNKNSDFKEHQISREGKKKMDDNLKMLDGSYDWETNKRSDFKEHQVSRQGTKKVGDNLGPLDGDYDWETNKKSDFKEHQVSKQQLSRIQDNLKPLEGKMKSKTEARKQFNAKSAQRQQPIRPSTVIGQKGEMEFKTHKDEDYRYYDGVQKLQQLKAKNNLHVMDKNFKLEGTTVARSTYQGPSHDVISDARISRSVAHKTSLAPLDGPLEGVSETKGNFTHKEGFERVQQVKHEGHLDLLRGVPFAPKSSTSMNDYQADLFSPRPAQIHYEDNLIPNGGIESDTSYKMSFDPRKVKSADVRPRPDWVETLITPFGPYAAGEARRPGQNFQVNATA